MRNRQSVLKVMQFDLMENKDREIDELKYLGNKKNGFHHFFYPHP